MLLEESLSHKNARKNVPNPPKSSKKNKHFFTNKTVSERNVKMFDFFY